jgi:hypothetical protein
VRDSFFSLNRGQFKIPLSKQALLKENNKPNGLWSGRKGDKAEAGGKVD